MTDPDYHELYSSESYAARYEPEKGFYPNDDRVFHRAGCFYDSVDGLADIQAGARGFTARALLDSGEAAGLSVGVVGEGMLRLRLWQGPDDAFQLTSPMVPALPAGVPENITVNETPEAVELRWDGYCLWVTKSPFDLQINEPSGRVIFALETEKIAGKYVSAPLGFRKQSAGERQPYLSWVIDGQQRYFGFGEKWNKVEKSSTRATIWSADTGGSNTNLLAYKSVPVLYSTAGWGLMLHSSYRSFWDVGTFSYTSGALLSEEPNLDVFFFLAPTLKGLIERYTALTGRPGLPPKWAMGVWMSRCAYASQQVVEAVVDQMRREQIPFDVIHLDPTWMKNHYYPLIGVDACDFDWDWSTFPEPDRMYAHLAEQGVGASMWINPYLPEGKPIYDEAKAKGYLAGSLKGGISRLEFGEPVGIVDLTNPAAKTWWKEHLKTLLRNGGAVLKCDYGDRVPEDALFFNGKTGSEMHNLYLHLYNETAFEASLEVHGEGVVWRRAGYIGSQRFPGTWAGDTQVTWSGMLGALRGGLSAGFTGDAFWAHDIGGFVGAQPSPELYMRWAQFGLLSPFSRFHGTTPREPWHYGEAALRVVRHYASLRYSLMPYFQALAFEANASGLPLMRHLKLEFPDEPGVEWIDDQYLLGPDLLMAPILQEGARERQVYFPVGRWVGLEDPQQVYTGPGFRLVQAPLEQMPVFARAGAVLPRYLHAPQHLKGPAPEVIGLDLYAGVSERRMRLEEGGIFSLDYQCGEREAHLAIGPTPIALRVRLVGWSAAAELGGEALPGERTPQGQVFRMDAANGALLHLTREE